jgi:hypothetical protein
MPYNKYKNYLNGNAKKPRKTAFRHDIDSNQFQFEDENGLIIGNQSDQQINDDLQMNNDIVNIEFEDEYQQIIEDFEVSF